MKELMRQIQALIEARIESQQQDMYSTLLAGKSDLAQYSAHRIACLAEIELEIQKIYKRLLDA